MNTLPQYRPLYPSASKLALAFKCPAVWNRGYQRTPREVEGQAWSRSDRKRERERLEAGARAQLAWKEVMV